MPKRSIEQWLEPRLAQAANIMNNSDPVKPDGEFYLGIDLGTSDVVSMVVNGDANPIAVCLDWADVVRDGIVWDFFGAVTIVRNQLAKLQQKLGVELTHATTSFPPGTDPRISVNVLESAGLEVSGVIDEPSAVAELLGLESAAVVDIGGGTTGVAVVQNNELIYSADEPTGGHHVSLTLAGSQRIPLEEAEQFKKTEGKEAWTIVRPVFQKMASIVEELLTDHQVKELYLSGGSCTLPGVRELFAQEFPHLEVILPRHPIFLTPLAIAAYRKQIPNNK